MTVPAWNPDRFHQTMSKTPEPPRPQRPFLSGKMLALGLALVFFGAAAVTATHGLDGEPDRIGVCHATGSSEQPFVWLAVDEDGYEHAHHRHHGTDFFTDAGAGPDACGGDVVPVEPVEQPDNATQPEAPAEPVPEDNGTDAGDAGAGGNGTDAPTAPENATEEPEPAEPANGTDAPANETVEPAAEPEPLPGDAWVRQGAVQDRWQVALTLTVGNGGDGDATDVTLTDSLPDLRRAWALGGADADRCILDGNDLTCWFGTLAPGETARVELTAYTDRMPCGDAMTNTATVWSDGDAEARNDASSAGIQARSC